MSVNLSPLGGAGAQFFTNDGVPLTGGLLYTYLAGTSTPATTYTSSSGITALANPIILDAAGRVPTGEIWLSDGISYKFVLKDSTDVLIATWDGLSGINSNFIAYTAQEETATATAGQTVFNTTINYVPATNNLAVFVNGSNQIVNVNYIETDENTVTFLTGLNVGDVVKFSTASPVATNATDAANVSYSPAGASAVTTNVQDKLRESLSAQDYGVVGDGITDDTVAFTNACAAAIAANKVLNIQDLKIYLATQAASIPSTGLFIQGSGNVQTANLPINGTLMAGNAGAFTTVKAQLIALPGSCIFSQYNGSIFTGQSFSGNGFTLMGFPGSASSSGFTSSTPTTYPGWSTPFAYLSDVTVCYFGSDGLHALGGSEVYTLVNVICTANNGYGLHIEGTTGVNSPIEFLSIIDGAYGYNLLGNIFLDGVGKHIIIDGPYLNSAGQMFRTGILPTTESEIIYPIVLNSLPSPAISAVNITVKNCYAEDTQGIVKLTAPSGGAYFYNVNVQNNYLIPTNSASPYNHLAAHNFVVNLQTANNFSPTYTNIWLLTSLNYVSLDIQERYTAPAGTLVFTGYDPVQTLQLASRARPANSGSLGDGTAITATYNIAANVSFGSLSVNTAASFAVFLVSANFQSTPNDNIGAYLVYVTRMSSSNYTAIVQSTGTVTGFSSAPTLSTAGVLSIPLTLFYRARVTRLDFTALS